MRVSLLVAALLVACARGCVPPDCDHEDCGGCANACCEVGFRVTSTGATTATVNSAIVASLKAGGADGRYTFVGDEDLRQYKIPDHTDFLLQAIHATKVHHYNDTLNFAIAEREDHIFVRGFSISQIYGAYCDDGQNYKNVVGFMKGVTGLTVDPEFHILNGCSNHTKPPPPERSGVRAHKLL